MAKAAKTEEKKSKSSQSNDIAAIQAKLEETEHKYKRALADYSNLEKRTKDQQAQFITLAQVSIVEQFLPVLDDLQRAAKHIDDVGLSLVIKQFLNVLENESVIPFDPTGQTFEPNSMECTQKVPGVLDEVQKVELMGYKLRDTVIRPAKVHVGDGTNIDDQNQDSK